MKLLRKPATSSSSRVSVRNFLVFARLIAFALLALSFSCGGGGGGSSSQPPPPPQPALSITTPTNLPNGVNGLPYSQTMQATGGTPPYVWSVSAASQLPAGLSLNSAGTLSGNPTLGLSCFGCTHPFTVQVQDAKSQLASKELWFMIVDVLKVINSTFYTGNVGVPYYVHVSVYGGMPPYVWGVAGGSAAPPGLTMQSNGDISGTPTSAGVFSTAVEVKDSSPTPQVAAGSVTVPIENKPVFLTYSDLPLAQLNEPYQKTIEVVGGASPYSMSISSGALPAGLTLDPASGLISGTPTQYGNFISFTITVTDASTPPQSTWSNYRVSVVPNLFFQTRSLPDGAKDVGYPGDIHAAGGRTPYTMRLVAGALPPGLSFYTTHEATGWLPIQGLPTATGRFDFTLEATESSTLHTVVRQDFSILVNTRLLLNTTSLPGALEGQSYDYALSASDGVPPYNWFVLFCSGVKFGCVPGLSLDAATGHLSGIPAEEFSTTYFLSLRDSSNPPQEVRKNLLLKVIGLLRMTSSLPPLAVGTPVQIQLAASGGTPPLTWSIASGNLPSGLTFDPPTARIMGTPTAVESQSFEVKVTDSGTTFPQNLQQPLSLSILASPGRNDSIATATHLSNGTFRASISPADDASGTTVPDNDYYAVTANPGAIITVDINADRLSPASPMDSVIEILDTSGTRLSSCDYYSISGGFFSPCMNDDNPYASTLDSRLFFLVPGTPGGPPVTFYVRVLDWSGMARPDFLYTITISGAN